MASSGDIPALSHDARLGTIRYLVDCGLLLGYQQTCISTGVSYIHRYYASELFSPDIDPYDTVAVALFIAGKARDSPRRLRDIINVTSRVRHPDKPLPCLNRIQDYKTTLVAHEMTMLCALGFDISLPLPHDYVLHFIHMLRPRCYPSTIDNLARVSWGITNDSFYTDLCLRYSPHKIACGAICLATELLSIRMSFGDEEWWTKFSANREELEGICHKLLDLYERNSPVSSHKVLFS